jgi:PAS domain S-box-containing protein
MSKERLMSDGHKKYPDAFKARVALESLKGIQDDQTLAERFGVTTSEISEWSGVLQMNAVFAFKNKSDSNTSVTSPLYTRLSSNDLAQTIAENSTQGFAMMDANGYCIYANRAWLDMTGYTAEEIHSQPLHYLVHHHYPDGRPFPMHECPIDRALPENFSVRAHKDVFFKKDGSTFEVMCAASPIFEGDKPVATVIEIRDITAQNALESALREESKTLELLNESAASIASTLDFANLIQLVTDASTELTGAEFGAFFYISTDYMGERSISFTSSSEIADGFEKLNSASLTALIDPSMYGEAPIRVDDILEDPRYLQYASDYGIPAGPFAIKSLLSVPIVFNSGEVFAGLLFGHRKPGAFRKRHERILVGIAAQSAIALDNARLYNAAQSAAEEKASLLESERDARQTAEQQNQAKDTFLAMLGHELRNPLHAISTSLELIELKKSTGTFPTKSFEIIQRQSAHLNRMVEDLLDASRMLTGKLTLNKVSNRFDLALMASIEALETSGKVINHKIKLDAVPAPILADTTRIDQVITNLLNNSLKYSPANSTIFVKLHVSDGQAILEIRDQGIGMTPDLQSKIFDPFVQGPRALGRAEGGLGMGLTIVKTLVTLHNGTIEAFSEGIDKGSTFTVKLPIAIVNEVTVNQIVPRLTTKRIVIIEDNEDALEMLKSYLEAMNCKVYGAKRGIVGLEVIKNENPDLAIIDIGLPDIDGYEVVRKLRSASETRQLKLIALTGYGSARDVNEAIVAGFDAHLTKPVNMQLLLKHISETQ